MDGVNWNTEQLIDPTASRTGQKKC